MATQLQKLMFSIGLLDKVTGPAGRIKKTLGSVANTAQESFGKIAGGAAGVVASGYAMTSLVTPAHEFNMAIGEVRSLDVAQSSLDALANSAISFSVKYGETAAGFVKSSYDIQSAIAGLVGDELASFTNASNILAKGTKSDAATITDYMGTMYGIFKESAESMGKAQWVEQLTGQTATAVQMFKTTGIEMASSFSSIGASATAAGIAQSEQIAVLGKLQMTMTGSEAGTQYKAFLSGVGNAQDKLGLKFTDSQGNMLGMIDILDKLKGKFGSTLNVAESDALKKAFGSDEAVEMIKLLMKDTSVLAQNIDEIGKVTGMEVTRKMAASMVDPFQRWTQGVNAVKIGLGQALLPILYPLADKLAEGAGWLYNWTQRAPQLTKIIGFTVIGVTALVAGFSLFAIICGMASMAAGGFAFIMAVITSPITGVIFAVGAVAAGIAALVYNWDAVKTSLGDTAWGRMLIALLENIGGAFKFLWDFSVQGFMQWGEAIESIVMPYLNLLSDSFSSIGDAANWIAGKLGFGNDEMEAPRSSPSLDAPRKSHVAPGGASKSIASAVTDNSKSSSSSVNIGSVTTSRPLNTQEINNMALMGGA
jgi:TP901 family phage tail tape measure protein